MEIKFFCPRWGSEQIDWNTFLKKAADGGYNGIEYAISSDTSTQALDLAWDAASRHNMLMIAQHYDTTTPDFMRHCETMAVWLERIAVYRPLKINSQTGKDFFSFQQNKTLIAYAEEFSKRTGIPVVHETHRGKFSYAAHVTRDYLMQLSSLKITLDVSHWVCVAESYLEEQSEALTLAIHRTEHIHARVGYPQGPQVPDPRVDEWSPAVNKHLQWWDRIVERQHLNNSEAVLTITPEFGPKPYMILLPDSRQPIADQWSVNEYMLQLLKIRYGHHR
jgi:sugar phosphate isomerase/epimerase